MADDFEESWTLIGTDKNAELRQRLMRFEASSRATSPNTQASAEKRLSVEESPKLAAAEVKG